MTCILLVFSINIGIKCLSNKKSGSELDRTALIFNCVYQS